MKKGDEDTMAERERFEKLRSEEELLEEYRASIPKHVEAIRRRLSEPRDELVSLASRQTSVPSSDDTSSRQRHTTRSLQDAIREIEAKRERTDLGKVPTEVFKEGQSQDGRSKRSR